ncbi:glycosyltransferase family 4 protein [Paenalcaligenes faecalis]|uniref:glycosyltransferase family 4 protein n=1 Tax=Paenalcaligenes faecalis TaxID=2980099 RepID=UPI0022B99F2E|nr:glycosyltransferase family 4 protein [Paenalcaligenes faecalis]
MKILFFVSSMNAGGAERVAASLANAWVQQGDEVCLVPTHLGTESSFYHLDERVQFQPLKDSLSWFPPFLTPVRKLRSIRQLHDRFEPDVVVSFLTNVNVNVLMALRGVSTPVIVCERTNPVVSRSADKRLQSLRTKLYPKATRVVVQTQDAAHAFAAAEPNLGDLAVIPNPIPPVLASLPLAAEVEKKTNCKLVAMGRLVPAKQFDQLIQVFGLLAEEFPEWTLHIHGEGPERENLQRRAELVGCKDKVFFPGRTEEPWRVLAEAQLFVLTSAYEGFPNVLLEAMTLGLPCVTVDCPSGPKEISNNGRDASLVLPDNEQALRRALSELMIDPRLRGVLGQRAAASVRERYGMAAILDHWDLVFRQAGLVNIKQEKT